jgi:hypothetical protein
MNKNLDSIKTIIIVVLVLIAGYFIYTNYTNRQAGQEGQVTGVPYVRECKGRTSTGYEFTGTQVVYPNGTVTPCTGKAIGPTEGTPIKTNR